MKDDIISKLEKENESLKIKVDDTFMTLLDRSDKTYDKFFEKEEIIPTFFDFLYENGIDENYERPKISEMVRIVNGKSYPIIGSKTRPIKINVAGKNFGTFDKLFLQELPWWKKLIIPRQRILDPAILCCKFDEDNTLPSLNQCKERLGIQGEVTHNALEDAWDVIQVLRNFY
jgi:hypothetical protein